MLHAVALYTLLGGCTCDRPMLVETFARHDVCARVAVVVQADLRDRFRYSRAISYCATTAAPLTSPLPMPSPLIEEAAR